MHETHKLARREASYWLRVQLKNNNKEAASLSLAAPESRRPAGEDAPLLLLRPKASTAWRTDLHDAITVHVSTPRVGYLDFTRWMANSTLRNEAYSNDAGQFEKILLIAYLMRHLDPRLAQQLDNLPDPAVNEIRVELLVTDSLTGSIGATSVKRVPLGNWLREFTATLPKEPLWTPELQLNLVFKKLDHKFSFAVKMAAGDFGLTDDDGTLEAGVPSGCVAQLALHAQVSSQHFDGIKDSDGIQYPAVFHHGLRQFATRQTNDGKLFCYPAASIRIETMYDGIDARPKAKIDQWIDAAREMIEAVPTSNVRRFDLRTLAVVKVDRNLWRLIGEIDVTTQRWRISGRPIYNFIQPRMHVSDEQASPGPALPISLEKNNENDAVEQFESEAFFDRPDIDAQTVTQRLVPLGSPTVLQQHSWDAPSATYFRHRFTLRSRYAGALRSEFNRSVDAWPTKEQLLQKEHGWTIRVAMLAEASRLILTRPQLRALIPLTNAPGGESAPLPAPPVAAILQEPPYSRGGLADRIAPEIRTGFGYGFEQEQDKKCKDGNLPSVEILDSRKEIGPNPQLDYRAFVANDVLGLSLRGEGPLGLTFDMPDAPAPAFPNTMLTLRPVSLTGRVPSLEESLMGVAMRRYLDPNWLTGPVGVARQDFDVEADRTWWIDVDFNNKAGLNLSFVSPDGSLLYIAKIESYSDKETDFLKVDVTKGAVDKVKGCQEPTATVAQVESGRLDKLAILNQPIAPGRYSTSILAVLQSVRVTDGESGLPLMLASFEWSVPQAQENKGKDQPTKPPALIRLSGAACTASETMASATTSLRWVQISRNFDFVRVVGAADCRPVGQPYLARDFVARIESDKIMFDLINGQTNVALCASTIGNPHPVHVHRHLAFITTRYLSELGRPVEVFCRRALATGPKTVLPGVPGAKEQAVRVVEFETPASIICDRTLTSVPPAFTSGYFDLVSTGYLREHKTDGDILVNIRFIGSPTHLGQFKKLTVFLNQPSRQEAIEIPIELTGTPPDIGAFVILRPSDKHVVVESWTVRANGEWTKSASQRFEFSKIYPGFTMELSAEKSTPGNAEFWTDVSILHCASDVIPQDDKSSSTKQRVPGPVLKFDFDWLFPARQDGEPAALVGAASLSGMTEAQARIISVSPPISIA